MSAKFRRVALPAGISGRLFLHAMPGREETWSEFLVQAENARLGLVICLAEDREISSRSPAYHRARSDRQLPFSARDFPLEDFGAPREEERAAFRELARDVARALRGGENVLVHCRMGIGRTGVLATCVLIELGVPLASAARIVEDAGSAAEARPQREFLAWYSASHCP